MARPDIAPGYGGWQAVDATPQERSKGKRDVCYPIRRLWPMFASRYWLHFTLCVGRLNK